MDTKILEEIGLTPGEIKTYLALLKLGSASTGPIAKESQVSRSKLYSILDKLEKKGLASHIQRNGVTYFQAVEPSKVKDYLKQKEDDLKRLSEKFEQFLPQLELFQTEAGTHEHVTVYLGFKGLQTAHEHTYLKLQKGEEYYYLGIPALQPGHHHLYWQRDHVRRAKAGIKCKLLFNYDTVDEVLTNRNSYKGCDARRMMLDIVTPAGFLIYKDTTTLILQEPSAMAVEIVDQHITDSFKSYFDAFWKRSKKFS